MRTIETLLALSLSAAALASEPPVLLTGEVFSRQAQEIVVPLTNNWQSRISHLVPEGSYVEAGEVVVEFDGTEAARAMEQHEETVRTAQARTERDLARLEKELAQSRYHSRQAEVTLNLARMRAEVPADLIGAIEHADNQLALEQAVKAAEDARKTVQDREKSLAERQEQADLDADKNRLQAQWWSEMLKSFTITAQQPGYVIYKNHPWTRAKFEEGDTVRTSFKIAQVANTADLAVRVWINSVDRPRVSEGNEVRIVLDAIPQGEMIGVLETIQDSGAKRAEWGEAVYFEGVVRLGPGQPEGLLPGMSVLVEQRS